MIFQTKFINFAKKAPTIEELTLINKRKLESADEPARMTSSGGRDSRRNDTVKWDSEVYTLSWSSDDSVQHCSYRASKNDDIKTGKKLVENWSNSGD